MPIKEFYAKFMELSRFAPEMLPNESTRARTFERKLNWDIKRHFSGETFTRLLTVYERAYNIETQNAEMA